MPNGYAQSASPGLSITDVVRDVTEIGNMACHLFNGTKGRGEVRMRPLMVDLLTAASRGNLDPELLPE